MHARIDPPAEQMRRALSPGQRRFGLLGAVVILLARAARPVGAQGPSSEPFRDIRIEERLGEAVPLDLEFRDEGGDRMRLARFAGARPVVLALVYHECPMLCTLVLSGLVRSLKPLSLLPGRDFEVVVVSINPRDTPALAAAKKEECLKSYGRQETKAGWHFLTGEEQAIERLAAAVGFRYRYLPDNGQYAHASGLIILTPGGRTSRYLYGVEYAPRDLRLALVEASAGKVGSAVDQVLLLCLQWDPSKGKYTLAIINVIRAAGAATVLALGGFILSTVRRERDAGNKQAAAGGTHVD